MSALEHEKIHGKAQHFKEKCTRLLQLPPIANNCYATSAVIRPLKIHVPKGVHGGRRPDDESMRFPQDLLISNQTVKKKYHPCAPSEISHF